MEEPDCLYKEILVELECPICADFMIPPIKQCCSGHCICQSCMRKLPKCPLCQAAFTRVRNTFLENMARKIRYPCINMSLGCSVKLPLQEREAHERSCSFRKIKCAMLYCTWSGKLQDVPMHWESKKIKSKAYNASNICQTRIKPNCYYANIVEAYDQLFWFKCKQDNGRIYWVVQFLGHSDKADAYFYEIEVFKPDFNRRRILFSDYCQSVELDGFDLFQEGVCVTAGINCLRQFIDKDQLLIYYMRIYKNEELSKNEDKLKNTEKSTNSIDKCSRQNHLENTNSESIHKMEQFTMSDSDSSFIDHVSGSKAYQATRCSN